MRQEKLQIMPNTSQPMGAAVNGLHRAPTAPQASETTQGICSCQALSLPILFEALNLTSVPRFAPESVCPWASKCVSRQPSVHLCSSLCICENLW